MRNRLSSRRLMTLVLICTLMAPYTIATAQDCGALQEKLCGYVAAAIDNWNARFSNAATVQTWEHTEMVDVNVDSVISILNQGFDTRVGSMDNEGNMRLDSLNGQIKEQLQPTESSYLNRFLRDGHGTVHVVDLTWTTTDGQFESRLIVNDTRPYLYDRILSSVVLEADTNSCVHKRLSWIWGVRRGEIFIDLQQYDNGMRCARMSEAWMVLGSAQVEMSEVSYGERSCSSTYAWAYVTPFASLTFHPESISFTIEGLGSRGQGYGDCVEVTQ